MEAETWKDFIDKRVRVIINDNPSKYPKHKDGIIRGFTNTHLILEQEDRKIALLLTDIRRMEFKNGMIGDNFGTTKTDY